jgi:hypothetical protein
MVLRHGFESQPRDKVVGQNPSRAICLANVEARERFGKIPIELLLDTYRRESVVWDILTARYVPAQNGNSES